MPLVCAIESSTPRASLCLARDGACLYDGGFESDRHHNALLFKPLRELVDVLGDARPDVVVIGTGPGSYSGTRVGIAAGQGLALVHGCPAVGLSSLLAAGRERAVAVGDARRGSAWWALIEPPAEPAPELVPMADLGSVLPADLPVITFEDPAKFPLEREIRPAVPTARGLAAAWEALGEGDRAGLLEVPPQPAYLRPPHITRARAGHPLRR